MTVTVGGRELVLKFGEDEGNVFAVSVTSLSLNIADVVTIEGSVSFNSNQTLSDGTTGAETFAGAGLKVFFGDGHVTLYYWRHVVLHAPQPGERVQLTRWYPGSSWVPTGYYRVRDAGAGPMVRIRRWVHRMMATRHLRIHQHTTLRDVPAGPHRPL